MKKKLVFIISLAGLIILGCATSNTTAARPSELVITRTDNNNIIRGSLLHVDIDKNPNTVSLESGRSAVIRISNGLHVINGMYNEPGGAVRNSMSFECFNERIYLNVEYISANISETGGSFVKLEITGRTEISQSQDAVTQTNNAINNSFNTLSSLIPDNSKIAILDISPSDNGSIFIQEELMVLFVNSKNYNVVERHALDAVREEQRFQMSGEVSDETAASIGQFIGADVVITGSISGTGTQRRLRLRAISVQTAQVIAMSSEAI